MLPWFTIACQSSRSGKLKQDLNSLKLHLFRKLKPIFQFMLAICFKIDSLQMECDIVRVAKLRRICGWLLIAIDIHYRNNFLAINILRCKLIWKEVPGGTDLDEGLNFFSEVTTCVECLQCAEKASEPGCTWSRSRQTSVLWMCKCTTYTKMQRTPNCSAGL